jgi:hypothetical protein
MIGNIPWEGRRMSTVGKTKKSLKEKIVHEFAEYWIIVAYLTLVFAAFTQYRRLVLAAHGIWYTNYWFAVIEALVLGKVIMIGEALHLGRRYNQKPLIYPILYNTVVFTIFVGLFTMVEHEVKGLWQGKEFAEGFIDFFGKGSHEILANSLIVFVTFVPFFAFRQLRRVLGEGKLWELFFKKSADQSKE